MAESKLHVHVMVFWNILCAIGTIIVLGRFRCRRVRCDRDDGGVWVLFRDLPRLAVTGRLVSVTHHGCLHLLHWSCDLYHLICTIFLYFVGFFIQVTARLYQDDYLDNVVFA